MAPDPAVLADLGRRPGGAFEVALLHYAVDGLLFDLLTTSIDAGFDVDQVVSALVSRLVGPGAG